MDGSPQRWWQWVLMYPTIAVALAGAIPQCYQWFTAVALGLPILIDVGDAQQQESAMLSSRKRPGSATSAKF